MNLPAEAEKIRNDKYTLFGVFSIAIVISGLICLTGSESAAADLILVCVYFGTALCVYFCVPELILKYLHFWVMCSWAVTAVFMFEDGSVSLRGKNSEHFGSLPCYVLAWLIFFAVIVALEMSGKGKKFHGMFARTLNQRTAAETMMEKSALWVSYAAVAILLICFLSISYKPSFLLGVDRFVYSRLHLPHFVSSLLQLIYCLLPVAIMVRKHNPKITAAYVVLLVMFCVWRGEKFSGLLRIIYFSMIAMIPVFVGIRDRKMMRRYVNMAGFAVVFLLVIVVFHQMLIFGNGAKELQHYFQDRLAAQGELWWLTYSADRYAGMHLDEIGDEIRVWISQPGPNMPDYYFGIYKLMKLFMNPGWVESALAGGVRATEATRAFFFYYGKMPGLILGQIFLGFLVYHVTEICVDFCGRNNWILIMLGLYYLMNVIAAVYMADFQLLTTKKMILVYMILIVSRIFRTKKRLKTENTEKC